MARIAFAFLFTLLTAANAFVVPAPQTHQRPTRSPIVWQSAFDDIRETVQEQVDNGAPLVEQAKQAGYLPGLHWGHGTVMAIVFLTMGITGAWLGWQIRFGNGDKVNAFTFGDTIREHHPRVMSGVFLLFIVGALLGLAALKAQGQTVLESPHARTAAVVLGLMAVQATLPNFFSSRKSARTVHAYLGSITMVTILVHIVNGIRLGNSF